MCLIRARCGHSTTGGIWSTRRATKSRDIPKTWDAFIDFFKPVQQKLRDQGMRHVYATGFVLSTVGYDVATTFDQFLIAHGGIGLVTPDGKLHADDPQIREAALKALTYLGDIFKGGYVPPGTLSWNDADDNNAFHSKHARHGSRRHAIDRSRNDP